MKNYQEIQVENAVRITIPVVAETTFADCKAYSKSCAEFINGQVIASMKECGIPTDAIFADIQVQPQFADNPNPYKMLMNVLKQFAGVASGGYVATIELIAARKEIERLKSELSSH
ncbi:hypothetical protein [uncultured Alistipes sp.]|jgi:hypothetical protein|uniref:hypothetical protein n=1 Tax=uncultured Alistipes sp. TaxID=538949 RepID=UPI0025E54645|nr:hypothetical protein [uncultured Alistipes sp.]